MDHNKVNNLKYLNEELESETKTKKKELGLPAEKFCKINGQDYEGNMSRTISGASCVGDSGLFDPNNTDKQYSNGKCEYKKANEMREGKYGKRPWCEVNQDRFGAPWSYASPDTSDPYFFGGRYLKNNACTDNEIGKHMWSRYSVSKGGRVGRQEFRKPIYYGDYESYNAYNGRNELLMFTNGLGDQKCWVGTPSYRKWDCVEYENSNENSGSLWGRHGVTRNKGYIIDGGTYEKISKITTSGIMGTKNWGDSCWTGNNKYKNFAVEENVINKKIFPTKLDAFSTYITELGNETVTQNIDTFDKESNNVYGISVIGQNTPKMWVQLDCVYGEKRPIIDHTFFSDGPSSTGVDKITNVNKGCDAEPTNAEPTNESHNKGWAHGSQWGKNNWSNYQNKEIKDLQKMGYILGTTKLTKSLIEADIAKSKSSIAEPKANLTLAETHEKNYNFQEGWMRITLSEKIQLKRIEFHDAYVSQTSGSKDANFSADKLLKDIDFEIYIYNDDYTTLPVTDEKGGTIDKIRWPPSESLQGIHKHLNKDSKDKGNPFYHGFATLRSPADDAQANIGYMTESTSTYSYDFKYVIEAKFILIRFVTRTTHYGISNLKLYRVYNNFQLNFANNRFQLQDQSGYVINHKEALTTNEDDDQTTYINHFYEVGTVQIIPSTNKSKILKFNKGSYKLAKGIPVPQKKIIMISTWFEVPIKKTSSYHFLVCLNGDLSGEVKGTKKFVPVAIDKDQNRIGCYHDGQFKSSNIFLGELKHGWHHLICFVNPVTLSSTKSNIYYYLNGLRKHENTWSGKITDIDRTDYKLSTIGSDGNSENWGASCSNLEIYLNFGHQQLFAPNNAETMIYDSSRVNQNKISNYLVTGHISVAQSASNEPIADITDINKYRLGWLTNGMMDNIVEHKSSQLKRENKTWKSHTCPNHITLVNSAINTAKSFAIQANTEKLKREQSKLDEDVRTFTQDAENEAHQEVIDYCSDSKNLIIWDNVDKHCYIGKKIELVVLNTTNLVIKNIQVLGEFQNEGEKDWIQDKMTNVTLSSLPNIENAIEATDVKTVIGPNTGSSSDTPSIAKCDSGYWLTGCKAISDDGNSNNVQILPTTIKGKKHCAAYNNQNSSGVKAVARCANISGPGIDENSFQVYRNPPTDSSAPLHVKCDLNDPKFLNKHMTLLGCAAYTNSQSNCIDKVYMENIDGVPTCVAIKKNENCSSEEIQVMANCLISDKPIIENKTIDSNLEGIQKGITNINQKIKKTETKSLTTSNNINSSSCNNDYLLLDGGCSSDVDSSCSYMHNPYELNKFKSVNSEYGDGVYSHANCVKFNVIDDNCIDGSLETICSTGNQSQPKITFEFSKSIKIKKIIIWNRNTRDANKNLPLYINIKDQYNNTVVTGIKKNYISNLEILNKIPRTPLACKNPYIQYGNMFNPGSALVNDNKINSSSSFRQWTKLSNKDLNDCRYCRIITENDSKVVSCTNPATNNQFDIQSISNPTGNSLFPIGADNSAYLHDESDDGNQDFCFTNTETNQIECLEQVGNKFKNLFSPKDQEYSYSDLTGEQIKKSRTKFDTSKCVTNKSIVQLTQYKCDAGFYCSKIGYYYLFKNSLLDDDDIILFRELSVDATKNNEEGNCLILNQTNWPGVTFSKIDATLYLEYDPEHDNIDREVVYFFSGKQYIKFDMTNNEVIQNSTTSENVNELNSGFFSNLMFEEITACCHIGNGICWFFNNDKFIQATLKNNKFQINGNPSKLTDNTIFKDIPFNSFDVILHFYNLKNSNILIFKDNEIIDYDTKTRRNRCSNTNISVKSIDDIYFNLWEINISNLFNSKRIYLDENKTKLANRTKYIKKISDKITNIEFECDN